MWIVWVVFGVLGAVPPIMLMLYRPKPASGGGRLHYSRAARIFLGLIGMMNFGIAAAASIGMVWGAQPLDWFGLLLLGFVPVWMAGSLWVLGDVWFIRHQFSDRGLDYRSPWSRHRELRWEDVVEVHWRPAAQWIDLHDAGGGVMHLSTMLAGIGPFCALALQRLPDAARERSPEAMRVLQGIIDGRTAELTGMNRL